MTLEEFIRARVDEDEQRAKAAATVAGPDWLMATRYVRTPSDTIVADMLDTHDNEIGPHMARHDPARVLREVDAKRRILGYIEHGDPDDRFDQVHLLMLLALPYGDHPDYQADWAP